jgi:lipopolysaccharide/colanic/teichoic acid biosynthesis glycosyltransferase
MMDNHRISLDEQALSAWARSRSKRAFDVAVVLASLPILLPLLIVIALAVLLTSGCPILFRQIRVGRSGQPFTIYKFRTMQRSDIDKTAFLASEEHVTPFGRLLRHFKLDEPPQVFNVLLGDMSLVGPRPKIPAQQLACFSCRPGITGPATLVFAREEVLFSHISADLLADFYKTAVLPAKQQLDADYMQRATLPSDLQILISTLIGNWGPCTLAGNLPRIETSGIDEELRALPNDS